MPQRRASFIFAAAVLAYMAAILQRSSLGVAGVAAADRFEVNAAALSSLGVMQLIVYAALQVPVGILVDRRGPRVLIIAGSILLVIGQSCVAVAEDLSLAVIGRVLVGAGDAMIFVSAMRLIAFWFAPNKAPQMAQWLGNLGQFGQVLSAVPFAFFLHEWGWTTSFLLAGSLAAVAVIVAVLVIADRPADAPAPEKPASWGGTMRALGQSLKRPGTQLGFWSHFVTQSPGAVFSLLWGFPFLVFGLGYDERTSASLLLVIVFTGMIVGPGLGVLSARFPYRRSNVVLGLVAFTLVTLAAVLLWPGQPPFALVILHLVALGAGGPGSLIGFDFARSFNPSHVLGAANGVVNVGGFTASFVTMLAMGVILDATSSADGSYALDGFRLAFAVEFIIIGFGLVMLLHARRRTRRRFREDDGITVAPIWVALVGRWRRRP